MHLYQTIFADRFFRSFVFFENYFRIKLCFIFIKRFHHCDCFSLTHDPCGPHRQPFLRLIPITMAAITRTTCIAVPDSRMTMHWIQRHITSTFLHENRVPAGQRQFWAILSHQISESRSILVPKIAVSVAQMVFYAIEFIRLIDAVCGILSKN